MGAAAHVIERLEEQREACNPEEILIGYAHDGVDQRKTVRNIERFGTEVMPHFNRAGASPAPDTERRSSEVRRRIHGAADSGLQRFVRPEFGPG